MSIVDDMEKIKIRQHQVLNDDGIVDHNNNKNKNDNGRTTLQSPPALSFTSSYCSYCYDSSSCVDGTIVTKPCGCGSSDSSLFSTANTNSDLIKRRSRIPVAITTPQLRRRFRENNQSQRNHHSFPSSPVPLMTSHEESLLSLLQTPPKLALLDYQQRTLGNIDNSKGQAKLLPQQPTLKQTLPSSSITKITPQTASKPKTLKATTLFWGNNNNNVPPPAFRSPQSLWATSSPHSHPTFELSRHSSGNPSRRGSTSSVSSSCSRASILSNASSSGGCSSPADSGSSSSSFHRHHFLPPQQPSTRFSTLTKRISINNNINISAKNNVVMHQTHNFHHHGIKGLPVDHIGSNNNSNRIKRRSKPPSSKIMAKTMSASTVIITSPYSRREEGSSTSSSILNESMNTSVVSEGGSSEQRRRQRLADIVAQFREDLESQNARLASASSLLLSSIHSSVTDCTNSSLKQNGQIVVKPLEPSNKASSVLSEMNRNKVYTEDTLPLLSDTFLAKNMDVAFIPIEKQLLNHQDDCNDNNNEKMKHSSTSASSTSTSTSVPKASNQGRIVQLLPTIASLCLHQRCRCKCHDVYGRGNCQQPKRCLRRQRKYKNMLSLKRSTGHGGNHKLISSFKGLFATNQQCAQPSTGNMGLYGKEENNGVNVKKEEEESRWSLAIQFVCFGLLTGSFFVMLDDHFLRVIVSAVYHQFTGF